MELSFAEEKLVYIYFRRFVFVCSNLVKVRLNILNVARSQCYLPSL
jgi:hypothetical protein